MAEPQEGAETWLDASTCSPTWTPPSAFDEYRLLSSIGRGAMGSVYLAHDTLLDRSVSIKFISELSPDIAARDQFLVEARAAARLQHPNVVTIHRVGELEGRPYIVAEFIRGKSLDSISKPIPWERALELGIGLSRGLAIAHRRGVLHRDIKPSNAILSENGEVKLVDFGLAKLSDAGVHGAALTEAALQPLSSRDVATLGPEDLRRLSDSMEDPIASSGVSQVRPGPDVARFASAGSSEISSAQPFSDRTARNSPLPPIPSGGAPTPPEHAAGSRSELRDKGKAAPSNRLWGTPLYMPPEIWRGEAAMQSSDVYSLGALLYELCAGSSPHQNVPLHALPRAVQTRAAPAIAGIVPGIEPRFVEVIHRCLNPDPSLRFASGDELREALEQIGTGNRKSRNPLPPGNPYRGLLAFDAEHRELFFGREQEIRSITERLRCESFVLIASDSGVGKSSLCCAGVLPLIVEGALGDGRAWIDVRIVPGRRPLSALVSALAPVLDVPEKELASRLRSEPGALCRDLRRRLGAERGLILFVDHLEDLVTISDASEAAIVGEVMGHLTPRAPGLRMLMTIRSDFLTRVTAMPRLGDELSRALYLLRPLPPEGIREAILGPARESGVSFESDALVDVLSASTAHAEGGLPLLQFTLAELWEARDTTTSMITAEALERIGGVSGSLARHADQIVGGLPTAQRAAARRILTSLVDVDGARASRTEKELVGDDISIRTVLDVLLRGRLLVARDGEQGTVYEVAHEALLKGWDTLRHWLEEQVDGRIVRHRLDVAAGEWERLGRTREALWSARQIAEAAIIDRADLKPLNAAFLEASERAVRSDRRKRLIALVSAPMLAGLLYVGLQIENRRELEQRVHAELHDVGASLLGARSKSRENEDRRRRALEEFDAGRRLGGDKIWPEVQESARAIESAYGAVTHALERALAIDPKRASVRAQLKDVLYERILATESEDTSALRAELEHRLELHDVDGQRVRLLRAPARLTVKSSPELARVKVARFVESADMRMHLTDEVDLGVTPTAEIELAQGSYMITIAAEDRAVVRYPVLSRRGERLAINVELPLKSDVPEGFVYIPPGRFLVGNSASESIRRDYFTTIPLHEVTTLGYLIARYETTYHDWIQYLTALPAEERRRRTPALGTSSFAGALHLRELSDGQFELTLRPTTQAFVVRAGQMITYSSRRERAVHDWRRFPVGGITLDDAEAYTRWLDQTGRVRGARLCTEYEWERGARGADGREYPNGSRLDPEDANFDETYGKDAPSMGPDEVGSHPGSESPFGLHDMAGNLFEWTQGSIDAVGGALRGGAWYYGRTATCSANRSVPEPTMREPTIGMRVCASLPSR